MLLQVVSGKLTEHMLGKLLLASDCCCSRMIAAVVALSPDHCIFCRKYYPTVGNSTDVSFFSCASVTTHLASPELVDPQARDTAPDLSKCSETGRAKSLLTSQAYEKLRLYRWSLPGVWGFAAYITATNYLQAQKIVRPQVVTSAIVLALHAPINFLLIYTFGKPVATTLRTSEAEHDLCLSIPRCVLSAAPCFVNAAFDLLPWTIPLTTDTVFHSSSRPVTVDAHMHNPEEFKCAFPTQCLNIIAFLSGRCVTS